jgi:hypothetical protein
MNNIDKASNYEEAVQAIKDTPEVLRNHVLNSRKGNEHVQRFLEAQRKVKDADNALEQLGHTEDSNLVDNTSKILQDRLFDNEKSSDILSPLSAQEISELGLEEEAVNKINQILNDIGKDIAQAEIAKQEEVIDKTEYPEANEQPTEPTIPGAVTNELAEVMQENREFVQSYDNNEVFEEKARRNN